MILNDPLQSQFLHHTVAQLLIIIIIIIIIIKRQFVRCRNMVRVTRRARNNVR